MARRRRRARRHVLIPASLANQSGRRIEARQLVNPGLRAARKQSPPSPHYRCKARVGRWQSKTALLRCFPRPRAAIDGRHAAAHAERGESRGWRAAKYFGHQHIDNRLLESSPRIRNLLFVKWLGEGRGLPGPAIAQAHPRFSVRLKLKRLLAVRGAARGKANARGLPCWAASEMAGPPDNSRPSIAATCIECLAGSVSWFHPNEKVQRREAAVQTCMSPADDQPHAGKHVGCEQTIRQADTSACK